MATARRGRRPWTCYSASAWVTGYSTIPSSSPAVSNNVWRLARAFISQPKILFADEPTGNLDAETSETVRQLLFALHRDAGTTLVIVTHDLEFAQHTQRLIRLRGGMIVEDSDARRGRGTAGGRVTAMAWRRQPGQPSPPLLMAMAAITVGIAAFVAITAFESMVRSPSRRRPGPMLGADLVLSSRQPLAPTPKPC